MNNHYPNHDLPLWQFRINDYKMTLQCFVGGWHDLRPDSIDLLFLGSFPDPFERVERDKNKN